MRNVRLTQMQHAMSPSAIRSLHSFLLETLTSNQMRDIFSEERKSGLFDHVVDDQITISLVAYWSDEDSGVELSPDAQLLYSVEVLLDPAGNLFPLYKEEDVDWGQRELFRNEYFAVPFDGRDMIKLLDTLQENVKSLRPIAVQELPNG
jgi:hypothetical protein